MAGGGELVIGLDLGTTNTKAVALDASGRVVAEAARAIATGTPEPGVVEQDPEAMLANAVDCLRQVIGKAGAPAARIAAIGIASQTETLVVWDRITGKPARPAMVWQCRRGAAEIAALDSWRPLIKQRTGLGLDPTFTAAKLKWVAENQPEIARGLRAGSFLWGTADCWLVWKLSGGATYATDPGNASRTMLFDIARLGWDAELIGLFGLHLARMPDVKPSCGDYGMSDAGLLGAAIPIRAVLGDQQASLFGLGCFAEGQTKITYGTGAFLWLNAGSDPAAAAPDGLIRTIAWQIDQPTYALEGFVMQAGAALAWVAERFGIEGAGAGVMAAAESENSSDGVLLVPAFQGLASPWWRAEARGALLGLSEATRKGQVARAAAEAVCFQMRAVLEAMGSPEATLKVDGGLTRSRALMQMQADILGRSLLSSGDDGATPRGAAMMAGLGAGVWDAETSLGFSREESRIDPAPERKWDQAYHRWRRAVDAVIALEQGRGG